MNYKYLLFSILIPVISITAINYLFLGNTSSKDNRVSINIEDRGSYGKEIIEELGMSKSSLENNRKEALMLLEKNDVIAVYEIPHDFTATINKGEIPQVKVYKLEHGNKNEYFNITLEKKIREKVKEKILINNNVISEKKELERNLIKINKPDREIDNVSSELYIAFLLIIFYILNSASEIQTEIFNLKSQKVLTRVLTTANKGYKIIGAIYTYMFIIQFICYSAVIFLCKLIMGIDIENLSVILIMIALTSMVSVSLGILISRITDNRGMGSMMISVLCMLSLFLATAGLIGDSSDKVPSIVVNMSKFIPQYWAMKSLETGSIFPGALILILTAIVLFTAGNFRLREFSTK